MYRTSGNKRRGAQRVGLWHMALGVAGCGVPGPTPPDAPNPPECDGPCPDWVIDLVEQKRGASRPVRIAQYDYQGMEVYFVLPGCCDMFSDLFDESGEHICSPGGGFGGTGDGQCPDFFEQATNERIVWEDPRR